MNSKVTVMADANGMVINQSVANPDYGNVKLQQVRTMVDDNGFLRRKVVSTLLQGHMNELQQTGFYSGQELQGNILIIESLEPFNKKNPERDIKIAGETGIICKVEGNPIYRKTLYSLSSNLTDTLIKHDNVDEMRAAYANANAKTKSKAMEPSKEFDI
jgi:hypothetical protein